MGSGRREEAKGENEKLPFRVLVPDQKEPI